VCLVSRCIDEQLQAALGLADGHIIEMQTGEGKTLVAVPAVVWFARRHQGVHVLTANEYLAQRDAEWMRGIYERLGLTVAFISQGMSAEERRAAYRADITYATANEIGFDYLRDGLAYSIDERVHRPLSDVTAVIDEADSILIDEARIPLVIAGGSADQSSLAARCRPRREASAAWPPLHRREHPRRCGAHRDGCAAGRTVDGHQQPL
jgi:preprotein translocase subunit SecA